MRFGSSGLATSRTGGIPRQCLNRIGNDRLSRGRGRVKAIRVYRCSGPGAAVLRLPPRTRRLLQVRGTCVAMTNAGPQISAGGVASLAARKLTSATQRSYPYQSTARCCALQPSALRPPGSPVHHEEAIGLRGIRRECHQHIRRDRHEPTEAQVPRSHCRERSSKPPTEPGGMPWLPHWRRLRGWCCHVQGHPKADPERTR